MNLSLNTIKIFCNPSHVAHPIVSLPLTADVWTKITQHSSSRPSQPEGYVWMHGDFGSKSRPFEKCKIPKMQNWKLEKNNFELKITRNCWILIPLPKKRYGCNKLKRKPILRSEALPPKFFIPEQKGKVVYKVPGDSRDPPPSSSKYLQKGHQSSHFTTYWTHQIKCILCSFSFSEQQHGRVFDWMEISCW